MIKAESKLGIAVDSVFMVGHVAEMFIGNVVEELSDQLLLRRHLKTREEEVPSVDTRVGSVEIGMQGDGTRRLAVVACSGADS